jgi:integrase
MTIQQATRRPSLKSDRLSKGQLRRLLDLSIADPTLRDLHDVVMIVSNTGIRPGELRDLLWTDVDLQGCKFTVAEKKNARMRSVPLGPQTLQVLQSRRERQPDPAYVLGESPLGLLHRVSVQLRTVCDRLGVRGVSLHVLRHTFAKRLVNANVNCVVLKDLMGHSSIKTTLRYFKLTSTRRKMRQE